MAISSNVSCKKSVLSRRGLPNALYSCARLVAPQLWFCFSLKIFFNHSICHVLFKNIGYLNLNQLPILAGFCLVDALGSFCLISPFQVEAQAVHSFIQTTAEQYLWEVEVNTYLLFDFHQDMTNITINVNICLKSEMSLEVDVFWLIQCYKMEMLIFSPLLGKSGFFWGGRKCIFM